MASVPSSALDRFVPAGEHHSKRRMDPDHHYRAQDPAPKFKAIFGRSELS